MTTTRPTTAVTQGQIEPPTVPPILVLRARRRLPSDELTTLLTRIRNSTFLPNATRTQLEEWIEATQGRNWDGGSDEERALASRELCFLLLRIIGPAFESSAEQDLSGWMEIEEALKTLLQRFLPQGQTAEAYIQRAEALLVAQRVIRLRRALVDRHFERLNAEVDATVDRMQRFIQAQFDTMRVRLQDQTTAFQETLNLRDLTGELTLRLEHIIEESTDLRQRALEAMDKLKQAENNYKKVLKTCDFLASEVL